MGNGDEALMKRGDCVARGFSNCMSSSWRVIRSGIAIGLGFVTDGQERVTNGPRLRFITWILVQKKRDGGMNPPPLQSFMATTKLKGELEVKPQRELNHARIARKHSVSPVKGCQSGISQTEAGGR